jgi:plastocyanin
VKRAVAALLALTVVVAVSGGPSSTAAAECSWQRHSRRVVKHVRRHGRLRKVVRRKSWWTCEAVAAPPAEPSPASPAPAPTAPSAPAPPVEPEPEVEANRLAVKSHEYYYVLSRPKVKAGELTVELNNQGEDAHNLNIEREGDSGEPLQVPETGSLQHNVATFDLPPGTYRLWCSLPEHEEKGMLATLVVE